LDDGQPAAERLLENLHLGVRLGPMLGLTGTLIPLGPALRTLGGSDFSGLAQQMIVSFFSTVVGLFIGAVCFTMHAFRQRWYTQDLNDLEFVVRQLAGQSPKRTEESVHEKYPPAWQPASER
jgi:biopolymer transport protein ExbB/TolQ